MKRLQGLKAKIKVWNQFEFGRLEDRRNGLDRLLEECDKFVGERPLDPHELKARRDMKRKLWEIN